jgi:hypothetical protein
MGKLNFFDLDKQMGTDKSLRKNKSFIDRIAIGRGKSIDLIRSKPETKHFDFTNPAQEPAHIGNNHTHTHNNYIENNYGNYSSINTNSLLGPHSSSMNHYIRPDTRGKSMNYNTSNNFKYQSLNRDQHLSSNVAYPYNKEHLGNPSDFKNDIIRSGLY